jgi:hypothetical protein
VLAEDPIEVSPFSVNLHISPTSRSGFGQATFNLATYRALRLRVENRPSVNTDKASTRVSAKITFYDESGKRLMKMDGRWTDSPQPAHRNESKDCVESLAVVFEPRAERSLDLLFKRPGEQHCVALNGDNLTSGAQNLDMPGRSLNGIVTAKVELNGIHVMSEITFKISCTEPSLVGSVVIENKMPS